MSMKYVAAYLLAGMSGESSPSEKVVTHILASVGAQIDEEVLGAFMKSVEGKDPQKIVAEGMSMLQSVPSGGAAAAAPVAAAPSAAAATETAAPVEAKKEESEEESDDEDGMGFSLFD